MPPSWRSVDIRFAPAGEDLVRIGLVADVPDDAVVRRVEDVVQRDRQLDRAEVRRQVAAGLATPTRARRRAARRRAASSRRDSRRRSAGTLDLIEESEPSGCQPARCEGSVALSAAATKGVGISGFARDDAVGELAQLLGVGRCRCRASARVARVAAQRLRRERGRASRPSTRDVGRLVVVACPCRRSCRASPTPASTSRMSSTTWNASPTRFAVVDERLPLRAGSSSPQAAPISTRRAAARRSCGCACRRSACSSSCRPTLARSIAWPPAMPASPAAAREQAAHPRPAAPARRCQSVGVSTSNASACMRVAGQHRRGLAEVARARSACRGAGRRRPCTAGRRGPASRRGSARPRRRRASAPLGAAPCTARRRRARAAGAPACRRRGRRSASPRRGRPARRRGTQASSADSTASSSASAQVSNVVAASCRRPRPQLAVLEDLHLLLDRLEAGAAILRAARCRADSPRAGLRAAAGRPPSTRPATRARLAPPRSWRAPPAAGSGRGSVVIQSAERRRL